MGSKLDPFVDEIFAKRSKGESFASIAESLRPSGLSVSRMNVHDFYTRRRAKAAREMAALPVALTDVETQALPAAASSAIQSPTAAPVVVAAPQHNQGREIELKQVEVLAAAVESKDAVIQEYIQELKDSKRELMKERLIDKEEIQRLRAEIEVLKARRKTVDYAAPAQAAPVPAAAMVESQDRAIARSSNSSDENVSLEKRETTTTATEQSSAIDPPKTPFVDANGITRYPESRDSNPPSNIRKNSSIFGGRASGPTQAEIEKMSGIEARKKMLGAR